MALETVRFHAQRISRWSAIAIGASIPVSTALDNVLLALTLAAWTASGQVREALRQASCAKVPLIAAGLFLLLAIGVAWGETPRREALSSLAKYADLLYIPIFMLIFRARETRLQALHAFALSLATVLVMSYLIRFGLLPKLPFITGWTESPTVFKLKLTHNVLMAFGAFLFVWLGHTTLNQRVRLAWYGLAVAAALNVLWLVKGATGYLILFALVLLLGRQVAGSRKMTGLLLVIAAVMAVGLSIPSPFQDRVTAIQRELQEWTPEQAAVSSTGLRLEFYHNTLAIIARHPLTGVGTGGFPTAYARQVAGTGKLETRNPHNEFLHMGAQVGILGTALLIVLFAVQWRFASRAQSPMDSALMQGLVLTMVIGCLLNSFLLDHAEGLFYAWVTGLLCAGIQYGPHEGPRNTT